MPKIDESEIQKTVTGRVVPHIYTFETNTLPNYLKVGDTYRPVEERLNEWRRHYKDLEEVSRHEATIGGNVFFRDYSVHKYLQQDGLRQIPIDSLNGIYSKEFFENARKSDVEGAVRDITSNYQVTDKYEYYDNLKERVEYHYERTMDFVPRDNQALVIGNFQKAVQAERSNLLMYAVMRFGKSITSMWSAKSINSKLTVVVSAKADVRSEWKQTVESHKDFIGYRFIDSTELKDGVKLEDLYGKKFKTGSGGEEICTNIVLFLTLQDLAGSTDVVKKHHKILKTAQIDLLIIDETHFGARAQVLGKILAGVETTDEDELELKNTDGIDDLGKLEKLEPINAKVKLHLSGTPYRILMGSEFDKEDIIAFVQFSDIYESKIQWQLDNLDAEEWHNPYYGFPQMVRFAFNPNESSRKKLAEIPGSKPSELFTPFSTSKSGEYETFVHEQEVIDLLSVLDGSKDDTELLGILNNEIIKAGKLARHIVMVLPYRASCDALEKLIKSKPNIFKNVADYKILNISGHNKSLNKPEAVKVAISKAESENKKTITLTVNKMLTGTTVQQWDTMIYLKGTASPQEYDQAIFRLQSPWVDTYKDTKGGTIRYDMKPQTLLVDLDPTRLFRLQEMKALTFGANTHQIGNENIKSFMERELRISPIIALNAEKNKLVEVTSTNIIDQVRKYASERTISEDVQEIGIDLSLKDNEAVYDVISRLSELGGKNGLNIKPIEGDGTDMEGEVTPVLDEDEDGNPGASSSKKSGDDDTADNTFEKQFRTYYVMVLLFAFLSNTNEASLSDVIANIDANDDNRRIANSLGLRKEDLVLIRDSISGFILSSLDYKIQNSDFRAMDSTITAVEHVNIAINKFKRLSDAEVFTPATIVDSIYDVFDDEFWEDIKSSKILDIASKSGSFAQGFVERSVQQGTNISDIRDNMYSIPTSPAAYEFTHKMYEALGLNIENIAQHFTSFDIARLDGDEVKFLLSQPKKFCDIRISDLENYGKVEHSESEDNQMKFTAVVGNPPYQENIEGRGDQPPIYHLFIESAYRLSDVVAMIHPARFLFNAGLTPKDWNKKMLKDEHLKVVYFEQNSANLFPNTDIKGGVAITLRDSRQNFGSIGVFTSLPELNTILQKVESKSDRTLDEVITGRGVYRLTDIALAEHPEIEKIQSVGHKTDIGSGALKILKDIVLFEDKPEGKHEYVQVIALLGSQRRYYWIDRRYINVPNNFEKYKIIVPKANGSGAIGEVLSTPLIGEPLIGYSETFIGIGAFDTELEANAALKYIKSKFARTMLGILKITQDNPRGKWAKVPLLDFSESSDINWTKSATDIDRQLYAKYDLSESEVDFIEARVKAMK